VDRWVASGEPLCPHGVSRRKVDRSLDVLVSAEAGDDRLGDCADTENAKVTRDVAALLDVHRDARIVPESQRRFGKVSSEPRL
jgi:hypothetical protein